MAVETLMRNHRRAPGWAALALVAVAGLTVDVRAAPPDGDEAQAPAAAGTPDSRQAQLVEVMPNGGEVQETPTLAEARRITARDLYKQADNLFETKNYNGALKTWELVVLLMPKYAAQLRVPLANAHHGAYYVDRDERHLHEARRLFTAQLASLGPENAARSKLADALKNVERKLKDLARAQELRNEAIRWKIRQEERAKHLRDTQKIYYGVGGSLVAVGAGSLAAMTAFLVRGQRFDRDGQALTESTGVEDGKYQQLLAEGAAQNRAAVTTGVVGGVLMAVGGSLLVVAAVRHAHVIRPLRTMRAALYPTLGGVLLRF